MCGHVHMAIWYVELGDIRKDMGRVHFIHGVTQPLWASWVAMARPMPREEPVTSAIFSITDPPWRDVKRV